MNAILQGANHGGLTAMYVRFHAACSPLFFNLFKRQKFNLRTVSHVSHVFHVFHPVGFQKR